MSAIPVFLQYDDLIVFSYPTIILHSDSFRVHTRTASDKTGCSLVYDRQGALISKTSLQKQVQYIGMNVLLELRSIHGIMQHAFAV